MQEISPIGTGSALRNENSYDYLSKVVLCIPDNNTAVPNKLRVIKQQVLARIPGYNYGRLYTQLLRYLEDHLEELKGIKTLDYQGAWLKPLVRELYFNSNQALERTHQMIEETLQDTEVLQTDHGVEAAITQRLSRGESISTLWQTTPQSEGSVWSRFYNSFLARDFKPQQTTSLVSIRQRRHQVEHDPMDLRMGTQAQRHRGKPRISPLFEYFLEICAEQEEQKNAPSKRYTHVYINNLGLYRSDLEGKKEKALTQELHALEARHNKKHPDYGKLAVITLPADKAMLAKGELGKGEAKRINARSAYADMLDIAKNNGKDFYISAQVKQDLYRDLDEEQQLRQMLDRSFAILGIDRNGNITHAQRQAVYFHFIKFEMANFIITRLRPVSFNMSCKDGIDRGGVSSAYYNLMLSFTTNRPMSKADFERALHAAPTLVKGRGMNHHAQLIWNVIDNYVDENFAALQTEPAKAWLIEWRDRHCPKNRRGYFLPKMCDRAIQAINDSAADDDRVKQAAQALIVQIKQLAVGAKHYKNLIDIVQKTQALAENPTPDKIQAYQQLITKVSKQKDWPSIIMTSLKLVLHKVRLYWASRDMVGNAFAYQQAQKNLQCSKQYLATNGFFGKNVSEKMYELQQSLAPVDGDALGNTGCAPNYAIF